MEVNSASVKLTGWSMGAAVGSISKPVPKRMTTAKLPISVQMGWMPLSAILN